MKDNMKDKFIVCDICGEIAPQNLYGVCKDCIEEDQRMFESVKKVMGFGEKITLDIISQRTGVSQKNIKRWIKQGRLQVG